MAIRRNSGAPKFFRMREQSNFAMRLRIPQAHRLTADGEKGLRVRQKTDRCYAVGMRCNSKKLITLTLLPQITPFPSAQLGVSIAFSSILLQQLDRAV